MRGARQTAVFGRYRLVSDEKAGGATYTPKLLADFVASQVEAASRSTRGHAALHVLDPAVGDGELLVSLLEQLGSSTVRKTEVHGFETNELALDAASRRLRERFPEVTLRISHGDFLSFVLEHYGSSATGGLFTARSPEGFDLVIANPPYVRTQIMGAAQARALARCFGLSGRVDLYYAFLVAIAHVLKPHGVAGVIVSNRFMTTKSGSAVRRTIHEKFLLRHVWDLGDTKLFGAAVLPAVLLLEGRAGRARGVPGFTSVYETDREPDARVDGPVAALQHSGVVEVADGRRFAVRHGTLDRGRAADHVWRLATSASDAWLETVQAHSWGTFRKVGKIRVGVKTCADSIFIRSDWCDFPPQERPELLRPLTTHHVARRFRALQTRRSQQILYPHEVADGERRAVDLARYPISRRYLEEHRQCLESRRYVIGAGRAWYELWVPQHPALWEQPKMVFRDISERPTFWLDHDGTVVNGDCYWLVAESPHAVDWLWLAVAVGNSRFIEAFYDHCFHNKLYSGRRRFITQDRARSAGVEGVRPTCRRSLRAGVSAASCSEPSPRTLGSGRRTRRPS